MSGIVWATLFIDHTELEDHEYYNSVEELVAETVRQTDGQHFEVQPRPESFGTGKVVVKYAGYKFTEDPVAEDKLLWLESLEHVHKAALMGYSDTSNAGWGYILKETEEDWKGPRVERYDGAEGARGHDVQEDISNNHNVTPKVPYFE